MRRKNLITALMCTVCLAASAPMAALAEETEIQTEAAEAAEEAENEGSGDAAEAETEDSDSAQEASGEGSGDAAEAQTEGSEDASEAETEGAQELPPRPDYTASDYVTLGEYKGLDVLIDLRVSEEDVDERIVSELKAADLRDTLTEGTVQQGDVANIDYEGKLNGEAFDGGTDKGYDLEIGSNTFIPGFEDGLIGTAIGDTVDLPLTFPEDYGNAELAGAETVFTVTVNEVQRVQELTDENASTLSDGEYTDAASYRAAIRETLEADMQDQRDNIVKAELMRQIRETSGVDDYPQELVDYGVASLKQTYQGAAESYGMKFEDFISAAFGLDEAGFMEQAEEVVKENMQQELFLKAIAEKEGIELSDEEYAAACERYVEESGEYESAEELEAAIGESVVRVSALQDKVLDFLVENAVVEEETEAESETGAEAESEATTE